MNLKGMKSTDAFIDEYLDMLNQGMPPEATRRPHTPKRQSYGVVKDKQITKRRARNKMARKSRKRNRK